MKFTEFQSAAGIWYVNCPAAVGTYQNEWWFPARIFNMDICEYIKMLVNTYKASISLIDEDCVMLFSFNSYTDAHRFVLDINKAARKNNFV